MLTRKFVTIVFALVVAMLLGGSVAEARHPDLATCQPLMTCGDTVPGQVGQDCPGDHACVCVPSCPNCRDCAAQVCVPVEIACHSACDCPDGMGCANGRCARGAHPVYCCDGDECPAGERCQNPRGEIELCGNECRTACDCPTGLACGNGECVETNVPVYCCESDRCPAGEPCQSRNGQRDVCEQQRECRTACDCDPGLGCFEGRCIAGFAPVFCCDGDQCPAGEQCQHRDGAMDRCQGKCVDQAWLCDDSQNRRCGDGRVCACSSSCPTCEDCGPNVCLPPDSPPAYRCNNDGTCAQPGDQCICVSSCPECDDCAMNLCVPGCDVDPMCEKRLRQSQRRMQRVIEKASPCRADNECVLIDNSTGCQGACGEYVNRRWARRVQNFINQLDLRYCTGYQEAGCPFATPDCMATTGACVEGMCVGVPAPAVRPEPRVASSERPAAAVRGR